MKHPEKKILNFSYESHFAGKILKIFKQNALLLKISQSTLLKVFFNKIIRGKIMRGNHEHRSFTHTSS